MSENTDTNFDKKFYTFIEWVGFLFTFIATLKRLGDASKNE